MGQDVRVSVRRFQVPSSHPQGDLRVVNFKAGEYLVSSILHHMSSLRWRGNDTCLQGDKEYTILNMHN